MYNPEAEDHVRELVKAFDEWDGTMFETTSFTTDKIGELTIKVNETASLKQLLDTLQTLHDEGVVILRGVDGP